jgi:hypothetical protein
MNIDIKIGGISGEPMTEVAKDMAHFLAAIGFFVESGRLELDPSGRGRGLAVIAVESGE